MKAIFITGTDTGVGKTLVAGLLAGYLIGKGKKVITQKWVATGKADDIRAHRALAGSPLRERRDLVLPYAFRLAASPHLAARHERRVIGPERIRRSFRELSLRYDVVIVEGTGGVLVPVNRGTLLIDIVKDLGMSALLVVGNKIGAINHALLSIEALKKRGVPLIGIVFNDLPGTKKLILDDNRKLIGEMSGVTVFGGLPRSDKVKDLKRRFRAIGDRIGA